MQKISYIVRKDNKHYTSFLPKYEDALNKWDLFISRLRLEFNCSVVELPIYMINIRNLTTNDIIENTVISYTEELPIKTKVLYNLELIPNQENINTNNYRYKIKTPDKHPIILKYISIVDKVDLPLILIYKFLQYPTIVTCTPLGRATVHLPKVTISSEGLNILFMYEDDDILIHTPSRMPDYIEQIEGE